MELDYQLISSTRFDPFLLGLEWNNDPQGKPSPFLLLYYHFNRIAEAVVVHGWSEATKALSWKTFRKCCEDTITSTRSRVIDENKAFKIRVMLTKSGSLTTIATEAQPLLADPTSATNFRPEIDEPTLFEPITLLYLDTMPTTNSVFTSTKTTNRRMYDDARSRIGIGNLAHQLFDVILFNEDGQITETSIYNLAFYRSSRWITPSTSTGCLPGVFRRWLLERGKVTEDENKVLTRDGIKDGDWVLLSNGVQGCRLGRVRIP